MSENFELPSVLYKYRDPGNNHHWEILTHNSIYLPTPPQFNDPFDCQIKMDFQAMANDYEAQKKFSKKVARLMGFSETDIKTLIENLPENTLLSDVKWLEQFSKNQLDDVNNNLGVLCLSKEPDNILLWSHYGNNHKGICIGFDSKKIITACDFELFAPVSYHNLYAEIVDTEDSVNATYLQVFHKSAHWQYENEYRGVRKIRNDAKVIFPIEAIKEIYLGCNIAQQYIEGVMKLRATKYPHVKIFRHYPSKKGFFLEQTEV